MVPGLQVWLWIWYGILLLGIVGLAVAVYWGRMTRFRNLDEIYRGVGTICVSLGMIFLLRHISGWFGRVLLLLALGAFIAAFVYGRRPRPPDSGIRVT
jgi:hypothetical protein